MTMDYLAQFSLDHAILLSADEVCNKHVIEFANDVERNEFFKKAVIKMIVKVGFTGLAEGMYFELRMASNVNLVTDAIVLASTGVLLPANLVIGDHYELTVPARRWPAGYDFFGTFYRKHTNVATAGTINTFLDDGPEIGNVVDTAI